MAERVQAIADAIDSKLQKGEIFEAYNLSKCAIASFPGDMRIIQLHARALAKLGSTDEARQYLEALFRECKDCETTGILGSIYKDVLKQSGDIDFAYRSRNTYLEGFERLKEYYLGINAATMSFILDEKVKAQSIAEEVIKLIQDNRDYWSLASLGEAYLILGDTAKSIRYYRAAYDCFDGNYGNLNSAYRQLCFIAKYRDVPCEVLKLFKPPAVITFAGSMIEGSKRRSCFPNELTPLVKKEIVKALDEINAGIGYCSAACGADILFIEAMLERGAEVNVYLPFCTEDFIQTSIAYAGREWEERFQRLLKSVNVKRITNERYLGDDELFFFLNHVIMGLCVLRAHLLLTEPLLIAVQDVPDETRSGEIEDLHTLWPNKECIRVIDLEKLRSRRPKTAPKTVTDIKPAEAAPGQPPCETSHQLSCLLCAQLVASDETQGENAPHLMNLLLQTLYVRLNIIERDPKAINSWGDSLYVVYDRAKDLIRAAFLLREIVQTRDGELKETPEHIDIRISLHAGPLYLASDPFSKQLTATGTLMDQALRIESFTPPGCIFASEQFTAQLIVETGSLYHIEYLGPHEICKEFGSRDIYRITRRDDFSFLITDYYREEKLRTDRETTRERDVQTGVLSMLRPELEEDLAEEEQSFRWLIPYMQKEHHREGEYLFNKGDKADKLYYLEKGTLRLKEIDITVAEGELIGEMGVFSPFHTRTSSAICDTDLDVYTLDQRRMIDLLYKRPSFLFHLIKVSMKRFTTNLAKTFEEKEKMESELQVAQRIQSSMIPNIFPEREEFEIFAVMEPAREVGGDFYDFFFINDDKFCFLIGDVSGKGIPASLFMVISKTLLKLESMKNIPPNEILANVNGMLVTDNDECMFVTIFLAVLDLKTGDLLYSNGGHNPPLVASGGADFKFLETKKTFVLGGMPGINFVTESIEMKKGDTIFLYTDGVNEAMNADSKQYSYNRLMSKLKSLKSVNVKDLTQEVRGDVTAFIQEAPQSDDITILALRYTG